MKKLITAVFALFLLTTTSSYGQGRSLGARMFTIENGPGNTLTFVYVGDGGDTLDLPASGVALPEGTLDQTLRYNGEAWVANDNLLNSTQIATVGGGVDHKTTFINSDSALTDLEYDVILNSSDSSLEITMPPAVDGQVIRLTDLAGGKEGNGVVIRAYSENSIEDQDFYFGLDGSYSSVTFVAKNGNWFLIDAIVAFGQG
jgi:hypothetical protein